ncbi:hypothetical protein M8W81_005206 [Salmonella enterica]|nr:hypothetical protein [Salmonella enterica]EJF6007853.1 hypothetical protein [Salmonella enterica]EJF6165209.1 hypothetical protein [Salmonella enterica]
MHDRKLSLWLLNKVRFPDSTDVAEPCCREGAGKTGVSAAISGCCTKLTFCTLAAGRQHLVDNIISGVSAAAEIQGCMLTVRITKEWPETPESGHVAFLAKNYAAFEAPYIIENVGTACVSGVPGLLNVTRRSRRGTTAVREKIFLPDVQR